jgi:hypothetical protein
LKDICRFFSNVRNIFHSSFKEESENSYKYFLKHSKNFKAIKKHTVLYINRVILKPTKYVFRETSPSMRLLTNSKKTFLETPTGGMSKNSFRHVHF